MHSQWPLLLYGLSLLLNWAWPLLFFVKGKLLWSAIDISALWAVVALAIPAFWHVHPLAGKLLIPYLIWLTLAAVINWFIVKDNAEPNLPPSNKPLADGSQTSAPFGRQRAARVSGGGGASNQVTNGGGTADSVSSSTAYTRTTSSKPAVGTTGAYQRLPVSGGASGSGGSDNDDVRDG